MSPQKHQKTATTSRKLTAAAHPEAVRQTTTIKKTSGFKAWGLEKWKQLKSFDSPIIEAIAKTANIEGSSIDDIMDVHLNRNQLNKLPVGTLRRVGETNYKDETGRIWELQPHHKNVFHQPEPGQQVKPKHKPYPNVKGHIPFDIENPNLKFLSKSENGASYEAILQPDGTYLTTGTKQGTYNFADPTGISGMIKHTIFDILPHFMDDNYSENE